MSYASVLNKKHHRIVGNLFKTAIWESILSLLEMNLMIFIISHFSLGVEFISRRNLYLMTSQK